MMTRYPQLAPYRRPGLRLRRNMHRYIDPILSLRNHFRAARHLQGLQDGEYCVPHDVPYVAQFASPALIHSYIHDGLHGKDDPNWQLFGAPDADDYTFWAHRACAVACVKMAADAYDPTRKLSMWDMVSEGIALNGYRVFDEQGAFVDEGWFYPALVELAARHSLTVRGMAYASLLDICLAIRDGWMVAAAVTPELGERGALVRYDGHFVLVYGFTWQAGHCVSVKLHNPSGRYPELQAAANIPARRFNSAFAHRFIGFRQASLK